VGLARAGVVVFWHVQPEQDGAVTSGTSLKLLSAVWAIMLMTVVMAVLASPIKRYTDATAAQLADPAAYVRSVLGPDRATTPTTRTYDGVRPAPAAKPQEERP
jgi:multicomponent K+:H+ antiporter subunit D